MTYGKRTCKILKEIRQQIADRNDIDYITSECHFQGECKGTCPKCEAELQYLENELSKRRQLGKAVVVAGIATVSLGMAMTTFSACNEPKPEVCGYPDYEEEITIDTVNIEPIPALSVNTIPNTWSKDIYPGMIDNKIEVENEGMVSTIMPQYPGGEEARVKFLQENIIYPKNAQEAGIEGKVLVGFVVEIDGSLTDFRIVRLRYPLPLVDEEALRVAKLMPKWIPGKQNGKPIRVQYHMPIYFLLDE